MSHDYRALLRDRRAKATRQQVTHDFCLDPELLGELEDLQAARDEAARPFAARIAEARQRGRDMMAGPPVAPIEAERDEAVAELDAQIDAKQAEVREASLILHFQAPKPSVFAALVAEHDPDADGAPGRANRARFMDGLLEAAWVKATAADGSPTDLAFGEVMEAMASYGEVDLLRSKVFAASKVGVDIPFSLRPSGKTPRAGRK